MDKCKAKKTASDQHKSHLRNVYGTLAAEGMTVSNATCCNLDRIARGQVSYQQVLRELRAKYDKGEKAYFQNDYQVVESKSYTKRR